MTPESTRKESVLAEVCSETQGSEKDTLMGAMDPEPCQSFSTARPNELADDKSGSGDEVEDLPLLR